MTQIIIYPLPDDKVAVIVPILDCGLTLEEIALKDVPTGLPYKIIDRSDLPTNPMFRDAWEASFDTPDGIGANHGVGSDEEIFATY
jgi:hypothetical protein